MNFFQAMKRGTQAARKPPRNPIGQTANERVKVGANSRVINTAPQTASEWRREQQSREVIRTKGAWSTAKVSAPAMESDGLMKRFDAGRKPDAKVDRASRTVRIHIKQ